MPGRASPEMSLIQRFANPLGLAWLIALTFVAVRFFRFIGNGWFAVRYPYEIDYGEGIVWQQADMILAGTGYGDITRFPFIVFHYPPIYHLAASATDLLFPGDWLAAGRLVALVSTLACACLCSWLVLLATRKNDDRAAGAILAAIAVEGFAALSAELREARSRASGDEEAARTSERRGRPGSAPDIHAVPLHARRRRKRRAIRAAQRRAHVGQHRARPGAGRALL